MQLAIAGSTGMVGRRLTAAATAAGHDVTELSRSQGTDLVAGPAPDLSAVDAVIDVTSTTDRDEAASTAFFTAVGATLAASGAPRRVLLSIVGTDAAAADGGHYAAKLAHERATAAGGGELRVLRATQFHDFPGQWLGWARDGDGVDVLDAPCQPVDLDVVVDALLELATEPDAPARLDLAGPRAERLPDLVAKVAGPDVTVRAVPAGAAATAGALLPGPDARRAGQDFDSWLAAQR